MKNILFYLTFFTLTSLMATDNNTLKEKCKTADAKACYEFALPLTTGDNAKVQDIMEEGFSYMRKACILGEEKACTQMGLIYYKDKSYNAAKPYLKKSCANNEKRACEFMAVIYRDGHDTPADDVKSREYFEKACKLKSADSCFYVAIIYRGGFGVEKSRSQEKAFYKKSCDFGLKGGCERFTELDNEDKGIETGLWISIKNWFK